MSDKFKNLVLAGLYVGVFIWSFAFIGSVTFVLLGVLWIVWWFIPGLRGARAVYLHLIVLLAVPPALRSLPGGWSLDSSVQSVDIHSGRLRYERYFLYMPVSTWIKDTEVSRRVSSTNSPAWRTVNTWDGGSKSGVSPHYAYHGANSQIRMIEMAWTMNETAEDQRRSDAVRLIESWTSNKGDFAANDVVRSVIDR